MERSTDVTKSVISISKHLLLALHKWMFIKIFFYLTLMSEFVAHARRVCVLPEERNYICDQCGQTFKQRKHLSVHQMRHSGAKPLQ